MQLAGSCHCGKVHFTVHAMSPYPFNLCYCSICRKTAGGGGYAINLGADFRSLQVTGAEHLSVYQARIPDPQTGDPETSTSQRHFCKHCGSALWLWDPTWPDLVHPFASAIDNDLPLPPQQTHMMLDYKANWVETRAKPGDQLFNEYPDESLAQWHERLNLTNSTADR